MSKINTLVKSNNFLWVMIFAVMAIFTLSANVLAQTVLQGYSSDEKLQRGMLVALKDGDQTKVSALTRETADKFKGVVVEQNDSPVTISSDDRKIFVAAVGPYEVLVSDENGAIKKGNYICVSSTPGIGALATEDQKFVVGVAANDFTGQGDAISSTTSKEGKKTQVGRIKIDVAFGKNPSAKDPLDSKVPAILKKISETVADKPVSATKIYVGVLIFMATAIVAGITLFSGVRSAVISIGRNPLSKVSIYRGLIQVVLLGLIIFITGIFGVYLVLKL